MSVAANLLEKGFSEDRVGTLRPLIVAWERFRANPTIEGAESAYAELGVAIPRQIGRASCWGRV